MERHIQIPVSDETRESLMVGDEVLLTGFIYTARDAAHKKMVDTLQSGQTLPLDFHGAVVYYVGPTPAKPGQIIGACGPTSSYRMDPYSPILMKQGLKVMIGKGERSPAMIEAIKAEKAVYLMAIGGIGALLSKTVKSSEVVLYPELDTEALRKLYVENFPAIVAIDSQGQTLFK